MRTALLLLLMTGCASASAPAPESVVEERHTDVPLFTPRGAMQPPKAIKRVEAVVPAALIHSNLHAKVVAHLLIDEQGVVRDAWFVGGDPRLAQAAVDSFMQWRFEPATLDGKPVAVRAEQSMTVSVTHSVVVH